MAHKVHPKSFRIRNIADWDSRGFYKNPAEYLEEDFKIRKTLNEKIGKAGVEKIEIERFSAKINIIVFASRPGLIIGRGGQDVEKLKQLIENKIAKKRIPLHFKKGFVKNAKEQILEKEKELQTQKTKEEKTKKSKREIRIEIREVKNSWTSASLSAQWVAQQIEKRLPFRKVLKQALGKISANKEIQGAKIEVSGRLNGSEIARREWLSNGRLPLQTLRSDIDYSKAEAHCTYGVVGVKVWMYKGEKFE